MIACLTITSHKFHLALSCWNNYNDAIKAGDGDRLHDLYKFAHLLFKANGKTKYSYAILMYLLQIKSMLSEEDAHNLKWNRFFNKHGKVGRNIPLDLRMEQLNKIVKTMWRALEANLDERSAARAVSNYIRTYGTDSRKHR